MTIELMNPESEWVDNTKVKVVKCVKCSGYLSVGWLFHHMKWCTDYCYTCHNFIKFKVMPKINYIKLKQLEEIK